MNLIVTAAYTSDFWNYILFLPQGNQLEVYNKKFNIQIGETEFGVSGVVLGKK